MEGATRMMLTRDSWTWLGSPGNLVTDLKVHLTVTRTNPLAVAVSSVKGPSSDVLNFTS